MKKRFEILKTYFFFFFNSSSSFFCAIVGFIPRPFVTPPTPESRLAGIRLSLLHEVKRELIKSTRANSGVNFMNTFPIKEFSGASVSFAIFISVVNIFAINSTLGLYWAPDKVREFV